MPTKFWDTKADFDAAYKYNAEWDKGRPNTRPGIKLHYTREIQIPQCDKRAQHIIDHMGWTAPGPTVVVLGAGFGWLVECFEARDPSYTNMVGVDTSLYIQAEKDNTEEADIDAAIASVGLDPATGEGLSIKSRRFADTGIRSRTSKGILNKDINKAQERKEIRTALGLSGNEKPQFILTESIIESLTDQEVIDGTSQLLSWADEVIHWVVVFKPQGGIGYNKKTLAEWRTLIPDPRVTFIWKMNKA